MDLQPIDMTINNSKPVLWNAVIALMHKHYGGENLNRLARDAKIGPATASRMKAQETSIGIETIDKLADHFSVPPWNLLLPNYDPEKLISVPYVSLMAQDVAQMLDSILDEDRRQRAYFLIVQIIQFGAVSPSLPKQAE